MSLEVPPLSGRITADLTPLAASFNAAVGEARGFKVNFENALSTLGGSFTSSMQKAVREVNQMIQGGSGFEQFKLQLRPKIGGDEGQIRASMADYIRKMDAAAKQQKIDVEVHTRLFGSPEAEAKKIADAARAQLLKVTEIQGRNSSGPDSLMAGMEEAAADAATKIGQSVAKTNNAAAKAAVSAAAGEAERGSTGLLDELSQNLSLRNSVFGKITRLLAGGGVIGGLGLAAAEVDRMAHDAEKFALAMQQGGDAARQGAADFLRSIPVVGQIGDAGATLLSITSGEAGYVAQIKEATEWQERHMIVVKQLRDQVQEYMKSAREGAEAARDAITSMGLTGGTKMLFDLGVDNKLKLRASADDLASQLKRPEIANAQADANEARRKLDALQSRISSVAPTVIVSAGPLVGGIIPNPEYTDLQDQISTWQEKYNKASANMQLKSQMETAHANLDAATNDLSLAGRQKIAVDAAKSMAEGFSAAWEQMKKAAMEGGKAIEAPIDSVREHIESLKMTEGEKFLSDFKRDNPGAVNWFGEAAAAATAIDAAKADEAAKRLTDTLDDPFSRFKRRQKQIDDARGNLTAAQIGALQDQADTEFKTGLRREDTPRSDFAPGVKAGSADEVRLQFQNQQGEQRRQYEQAALDLAKQQIDLQKQMVDALGNTQVFDLEGAY